MTHASRQYSQFFQLSNDLFCVADMEGRFIEVNPAWERVLGYSSEELTSRPFLDFVHPDDRNVTSAKITSPLDGGGQALFTNRYRHKDGSFRWLQWEYSIDFEERKVYAVARDVTEQRKLEEKECRSRRAVIETLERVSDAFFALDADWNFTYVNALAAEVLQRGSRELIGRNLWTEFPEVLGTPFQEAYERAMRTQQNVTVAAYYQPFKKWIDVRVYPSVNGISMFFKDVTPQVEADMKLKFAQTSLMQADKLATLGLMAAGVAHEINNPLGFILANLEKVKRLTDGSQEICFRVSQALQGVERVSEIVRTLKSFSASEVNEGGLFDIYPTIEFSISIVTEGIRPRARLVRDFQARRRLKGSSGRLGQVVLNLLTNAAQAIPDGATGESFIWLRTYDRGNELVIEVEDTGIGIPPENLDRIFEPFFTTKATSGTGLGLPICRDVVVGMGGRIEVRSAVGSGTVFTLVLPSYDLPSSPKPRERIEPAPVAKKTRKPRVMILEDEAAMAEVLAAELMDEYEVHAYTDPIRALPDLDSGFDVIVCDLMMPGMQGPDVHAYVLAKHPELETRMVFMTGGAFNARANGFLDRVANPKLVKPFRVEELRSAISKVLPDSG